MSKLRLSLEKSAAAYRLARLEDALLDNIGSTLAKYGFERWLPDIFEDPYSAYNTAHRYVCLETFKQACAASQYRMLEPNLAHLANHGLLTRLFDHYIFYHLKKNTEVEQRQPGTLERLSKESSALSRRTKVCLLAI